MSTSSLAASGAMWPLGLRCSGKVTRVCFPELIQALCKLSVERQAPTFQMAAGMKCGYGSRQNNAGFFHHSENNGATTRPIASVLM